MELSEPVLKSIKQMIQISEDRHIDAYNNLLGVFVSQLKRNNSATAIEEIIKNSSQDHTVSLGSQIIQFIMDKNGMKPENANAVSNLILKNDIHAVQEMSSITADQAKEFREAALNSVRTLGYESIARQMAALAV